MWEPFVNLYQQLEDDRGGLAVGSAVALLGGKGVAGKGLGAGPAKPDGFLKGVRTGELTVDDVSRAWDEAHAEVALRERILSLRGVPLPSAEQLVRGKVDLAHHEAQRPHPRAARRQERHVPASPAAPREGARRRCSLHLHRPCSRRGCGGRRSGTQRRGRTRLRCG